jgi:hypothetical protein
MAQTVLITLTTAGADTGPFDLYSNADSYTSPFATGIAKATLVGGYTSIVVPDLATIIRVKSTSLCTNYVDLPISGTTTTTSTTQSVVTIFLYARQDPAASVFPLLRFSYSQDGGLSWLPAGASFTDTDCLQRAALTVTRNSPLIVKLSTDGDTSSTWQSARDITACPSFTSPSCQWNTITNLSGRTFYFTVNGDNQGTC